jgi:hypothetical protein
MLDTPEDLVQPWSFVLRTLPVPHACSAATRAAVALHS